MTTIKIHSIISFSLVLSLPIHCEVSKNSQYLVLEVSGSPSNAAFLKKVVPIFFLKFSYKMQDSLRQEDAFTPCEITEKQLRKIVYEFLELSYEEVRTDNGLQMSLHLDLRVIHIPMKASNKPSSLQLMIKADLDYFASETLWPAGLGK